MKNFENVTMLIVTGSFMITLFILVAVQIALWIIGLTRSVMRCPGCGSNLHTDRTYERRSIITRFFCAKCDYSTESVESVHEQN